MTITFDTDVSATHSMLESNHAMLLNYGKLVAESGKKVEPSEAVKRILEDIGDLKIKRGPAFGFEIGPGLKIRFLTFHELNKLRTLGEILSARIALSRGPQQKPNILQRSNLSEFLICIFVPPNRQDEILADMTELFNTVWLPRFGPRLARFVYFWHALGFAVRLAKATVVTVIVAKILRFLHWDF